MPASDVRVYAIRNPDDYRVAYTRYCLMDAHRRGALVYEELGVEAASRAFGLGDLRLERLPQGISLFVAVTPRATTRFVVDNSDGFLHLSPLLKDVDLYLAGPYLPDLHGRGIVPAFEHVRNRDAVLRYREISARLLKQFEGHLDRVRPYIPMQFRMHRPGGGLRVRAERLLQRRRFARTGAREPVRRAHESRYREVLELRSLGLKWDAVARDSLWGTKSERTALHRTLAGLSGTYRVHAELLEPAGARFASGLDQRAFEAMLASSRICPLARGKHVGWREVGFLVLALGIPTLMPKPVYQPYTTLDAPGIWHTDGDWSELPGLLREIDDDAWFSLKQRGQRWFDERFSPAAVADYILGVLREAERRT